MPWIKQKELEWLFKHSYYPALIDKDGKFHFGTLPPRETILSAVKDAISSEEDFNTWKEIK